MAKVVTRKRSSAIDPLKHSQPTGGAMVFLGLAAAMPVLHGSKGCTAFAKTLMTRHFREPIPLQTTAVTEVSAVFGAGEQLVLTLDAIRDKHRPEILGVLTTGLTEVSGEDVAGEIATYIRGIGVDGPLVVAVSTPDFRGGLSDGWAAALEALVAALPLARTQSPPRLDQAVLLTGPATGLSAVDLDEVKDILADFGISAVAIPDLAGSLDGHLAPGFSSTTTGGTTLAQLRELSSCGLVISIGSTTTRAAHDLAARTGARLISHPHLCGLAAVDAFVHELAQITGRPVPERLLRWRSRLADGLMDCHFVLAGARVALAAEPESLLAIATLLRDVGAEIVAAVSPTPSPILAEVPCAEVVIGDLADLEERAGAAGAELVVGGAHARASADRIRAAHLPVGFPVFDRLGAQLRACVGYRGSLQLLVDVGNRLLDHHEIPDHTTSRVAGTDEPVDTSSVPLKEPRC